MAHCEVLQLLERWRDEELDESGPEIDNKVQSIYSVLHERKYRSVQKLARMCRSQAVQLFASFDMLGADFDAFEDMVFMNIPSMSHFNIRPSVDVELPGVSIKDQINKRKRGGSMTPAAGELERRRIDAAYVAEYNLPQHIYRKRPIRTGKAQTEALIKPMVLEVAPNPRHTPPTPPQSFPWPFR